MAGHLMASVNVLDARSLLSALGVAGVALIMFAETGLLVGLFLPGDSLLFTAGVLAATRASDPVHLPLGWVLVAAVSGALLGAQVGYAIGRFAGPRVFDRPDRPRLADAHRRTRSFLHRYGVGRALVLARFVPVVRTAISPLAGATGVGTATFTLWQVVGGLLWSLGVTLAGWALGSHISNIDHYLLPVVAVIIVVSLLPIAIELLRTRRRSVAGSPPAGGRPSLVEPARRRDLGPGE